MDSKVGRVPKSKEETITNSNSKAIYVIFCGINLQEFKRFPSILLQRKMQDFETICQFYAKLYGVFNQAFALSEEYYNSKLVRKVLRSLPGRFLIKAIAIEEAKDLESLKINDRSKGEKSIALQVVDEILTPNATAVKKLQEQIALLIQNFNKTFEKQARRFKKFEASKNNPKSKNKGVAIKKEAEKEKKAILCHECLSYGHIQTDDEDFSSNSESDEDQVNNYVTFASSVVSSSKGETNDDLNRGSKEDFLNIYKTMLRKWEQACDLNAKLTQENIKLKEKNMRLTKQIEAKESLLTKQMGRICPDKRGFGCVDKGKAIVKNPTIFVKGLNQVEPVECSTKAVLIKTDKKVPTHSIIICHYCGAPEHIKPRCFKMLHDLRWKRVMLATMSTTRGTLTARK
ncbi:hypothetical protein Goshw_002339 [Gossypium schwendimanii]|uniref:CCHC-type domain-containing protein n=1 Tax=Gossypium schwendimanii TaxID=34291 RepID=A0A7J9LT85_GOSSC|nr:hypothetical protein [Gossypium schwendimanii]